MDGKEDLLELVRYSHVEYCRSTRRKKPGKSREFMGERPAIMPAFLGNPGAWNRSKIPGKAGKQQDFPALAGIYSIPLFFRREKTLENLGKALLL